MRRLIGGWLLLCLLLPGLARAGAEAGQQYLDLPFPSPVETGNKIEVREFFWYGCPHCYALEPALTLWLKHLPANAQFVRTPGTASPAWSLDAQAYYTFQDLGLTAKLHQAYFTARQEQHEAMIDEKAITDFAVRHGVDRKRFSAAFNSFGVHLKLEQAKQLNQDLNIDSVPTLVVDGKYLTSPAMAGGEDGLFKVLDQLISKAARERKTRPVKH
ncbi:MAG: thiol:disulfide interchange protein DsbA/DsbL [Sulfuricaulis sp.]